MPSYKSKLGKPDSKGNFKRDLGKQINRKPFRFYLGQDPEQAEQRIARLEKAFGL